MDKELLEAFATKLEGEFLYDSLHRFLYATDASVYRKIPLAIAYPKSIKDLQQLIQFALKNSTSLIPRTAGTSLAGQVVGKGIVVDVSKYLTKIISLDLEHKTVTVEPGVIRDELNEYLKPYGLFFGPNTSTSNRCMIGGMVGNNSSGTTSIQYGVTRDKIIALETILSDGSVVTFSEINATEITKKIGLPTLEGAIYKQLYESLSSEEVQKEIKKEFPKSSIHRRNTGYALDALLDSKHFNISKLLCGSEGTLAFTTKITLQLDSLPPQHTVMVATQYQSLSECMKDVVEVMKHNLYTCELVDDVILDCTRNNRMYEPYRFFIKDNPKAILLLELRGKTPTDLEYQVNKLLQSIKETKHSNHQTILRGQEIEDALELRKAGLGLLGNMVGDKKAVACIEDTAVALEDLPNYINEFSALMDKYQQKAVYYAHAGAGELHLRPILDLKNEADVVLFRKITTDVAALVKKYKGSFSGEHGDGIVRSEFLEGQIGTQNFQLLKTIKYTFDPQNIFNPGKITNAWKMDENLRYQINSKEPEVKTFLDFKDSEGILRLSEKCNGSGDCRKTAQSSGMLCPSYHATKNEKDTTRGRANVLREVLTQNTERNKFNHTDLKEAFDLCISCKACATECPSNVDMATAKAEFLYQYQKENGVSRAQKLFGLSSYYHKKATKFPTLVNFIFTNKFTARAVKKYSGIALERSLPLYSSKRFDKEIQVFKNEVINYKKELYLFIDEFSNFLEASLAKDAYLLLTTLGYKVHPVTHLDSARAMLSKGFLEEAKKEVDKNLLFFNNKLSKEIPLIGIEPSAILGFRDEYKRLATDETLALEISNHTYLIEEFIASEIEKGNITSLQFTKEEKQLKLHIHCHQKVLSSSKATFDMLNLPVNYKPTIITSGCCGMAGSFGYEKEHYTVSMQIAETKLFPTLRKTPAETIIVANGTSCRHQIMDGLGKQALHPVSVLFQALSL